MSEPITMIQKPDAAPARRDEFDLTAPMSADHHDLFLLAWKRGVRLSGHPAWFGAPDPAFVDRARSKDQLQPRVKDIAKAIATIPQSQACLIAAMVSFYAPAEGARLAAKLDANGIGDIIRPLNGEQRLALALMAVHYQGW